MTTVYENPNSWQSLAELFLAMINGILMLTNALVLKVGTLFYGLMIILIAITYSKDDKTQRSESKRHHQPKGPLNNYKIIAILLALMSIQIAMTSYGLE